MTDPNTETLFSVLSENRTAWLEQNDSDRDESGKAFAALLEKKGFAKGKDKRTSDAIRIGIKLKVMKVASNPETNGMSVDEPDDVAAMLDHAATEHDQRAQNELLEMV